jgi:DNA (cytosine-5)-methyltransferase 1
MAIQQEINRGLRELALFAGAGGGILGGHLLGWRTVCAVEWDAYAASVLVARQNDGCLPPFPIWDDVQTFDGRPWRGIIDVVSGGFPCQDISCAGKGAGIEGERSGMWVEMARIISEVRPRYVFVENSPMLTSRGLGRVLGDLATMGYDARWGVLGASDVGSPHRRERIWIVADSKMSGQSPRDIKAQKGRRALEIKSRGGDSQRLRGSLREWIETESGVRGMVNDIPEWVDRIERLGNGQVPAVAALAWNILSENPLTAPRK